MTSFHENVFSSKSGIKEYKLNPWHLYPSQFGVCFSIELTLIDHEVSFHLLKTTHLKNTLATRTPSLRSKFNEAYSLMGLGKTANKFSKP